MVVIQTKATKESHVCPYPENHTELMYGNTQKVF